MKENKYDDGSFFKQYEKMTRSQKGLEGAGEWYVFKEMLPDLNGKKVLDLGCGYGWHCRHAIENGADSVIGVDISEKMLGKAKIINQLSGIKYQQIALEDTQFAAGRFDVIISSLTFHYLQSYDVLIGKIYRWLKLGGRLVFSVEHPVFTAQGKQNWIYNKSGNKMHWAVDRYFYEGRRNTSFLGAEVVKYHRTVSTYLNELLNQGFKIIDIKEPIPSETMLKNNPEMKDELRRPMMLLIAVEK